MSKAHQPGDSRPVRSRLPSTKSVLGDFGDLSESEQTEFLRDVLLTADSTTDRDVLTKVAEFVEEYPERARLPIGPVGQLFDDDLDGPCRGGSDRGRQPRSQSRAEAGPHAGPDPTGEAAPGHGPGLCESAGRCAGRWSQP